MPAETEKPAPFIARTMTTLVRAMRSPRARRLARRARGWSAALAVLALTACSLWRAPSASFRDSETALEAAREQASIACIGPSQCDALWTRAAAFVRAHASTRIVRADEDAVETARPGEFGIAYFWVQRVGTEDGNTVIRLKGMCRGMYTPDGGPGWTYASCAKQIADSELRFRRDLTPVE